MKYFYSCDWGTTAFRLRLVERKTLRVLAQFEEGSGVKTITAKLSDGDRTSSAARAQAFASFVRSKLLELNQADSERCVLIISGMASSSVGWKELPYARTPFALSGEGMGMERVELEECPRVNAVYLISGLTTGSDVMRGEETEIVGLFAGGGMERAWEEAVVILPGTHSKHIYIKEGAIVDFRTYMTGELFEILSKESLLRFSVRWPLAAGSFEVPENQEAFREGVRRVRAEGLPGTLFRVRTRSVLNGVGPEVNGWYLSGLMIGSELGGLVEEKGRRSAMVLLAAVEKFRPIYQAALETLGLNVEVAPASKLENAVIAAHAKVLDLMERR